MSAFDVCIRGAGPVGRSLALALSRHGFRVAIVDAGARGTPPARADIRAYALNAASAALLRELRVWDALPQVAVTPVQDMRVFGDAQGHLEFSAWQQCVDALAWIVDAAALDAVLADALRFAPHVQAVAQPAEAALQAVCEGRDSAARAAFGAGFESRAYGHAALATRVVSELAHGGVAWQWFRSPDVLALLPLDQPEAGRSYAVVWSQPAAQAQQWRDAETADFERALNEVVGASQAAATGADGAAGPGTLRLAGERATWPLAIGHASRWCGPGWVLLGDAAHTVHPLSGQGLNLGFGDVECLVRHLDAARAREPWRTPGDERVLRRYARERALPTQAMFAVTDGLWHLFSHEAAPLAQLRNRGLTLVNRIAPVKRWLAGRALGA